MGRMAELEADWREAVEGMKFFDEPVRGMDAERLLLVIGFLVSENRTLKAMCGMPPGMAVPDMMS